MNIADLLLSTLPGKKADGETPEVDVEAGEQFDTFMAEAFDSETTPEEELVAKIRRPARDADIVSIDLIDSSPLDTDWDVETPNAMTSTPAQILKNQEPPTQDALTEEPDIVTVSPMGVAATPATLPEASKNIEQPIVKAQDVAISRSVQTPLPQMSVTPQITPVTPSVEPILEYNASVLPKNPQVLQEVMKATNAPMGELRPSDGIAKSEIKVKTTREAPIADRISRVGSETRTETAKIPVAPKAPNVTTNTSMAVATPYTQETVSEPPVQTQLTTQFQILEPVVAAQFSLMPTIAASSSPVAAAQILQATPQRIINQIANVIATMSDGNVELRLDPPELGRLIVSITQTDTGVNAHIVAEKPDMVEFLRRNADIFARELARSGFEDATLEFSHKERQANDPELENLEELASPTDTSPPTVAVQTAIGVLPDGLDIRL